ncbi:hypothetical protein V2G26_013092 [Clonostachys chloroleuca]
MKSSILTAAICSMASVLGAHAQSRVDTHSHYLPDFYQQALRDAGHLPGPDGMPAIPEWDPESHLQFMKNQSISKSYLSISSPGVYLTPPSKAATAKAIKLARQVNEYGSKLKAKYPDQFGFFASLPLPDVKASLEEIKYCFNKLNPKPDGIVVMSNYYGLYLGDPELDPVYEALNKLGVTIFEHPTTPCTVHNHKQYTIDDKKDPKITQKEWQALNRPIADRMVTAPLLDFPFDTARTVADLFLSGVPARFSNIRWIIPHAGGGLIPTLDRLLLYPILYPGGATLTADTLKEALSTQFYFDLAGPWPVNYSIPPLLRWVNYTNILSGSDVPFTSWAAGAAGITQFESVIGQVFDDQAKVQAIRSENALGLLSKK